MGDLRRLDFEIAKSRNREIAKLQRGAVVPFFWFLVSGFCLFQ
jgi:hypothetical protein